MDRKSGRLIAFHNKKDAFYNISLWQFRYKNDNIGKGSEEMQRTLCNNEKEIYLRFNQNEII